jgi:hypothetical protein
MIQCCFQEGRGDADDDPVAVGYNRLEICAEKKPTHIKMHRAQVTGIMPVQLEAPDIGFPPEPPVQVKIIFRKDLCNSCSPASAANQSDPVFCI